MAGIVKPCVRRSILCCDFWFFATLALAIYLGGEVLDLLLAAVLHEAGHALALLATNNSILQLQLKGFGVKIIPHYRKIPTAGRELLVLFSGPLAGLLGAGLARPFALRFSKISLLLAVFNLLPVRGLDGGSMLRVIWQAAFNDKAGWMPNAVGAAIVAFSLIWGAHSLLEDQANIPLIGVALFLALKQFSPYEEAD